MKKNQLTRVKDTTNKCATQTVNFLPLPHLRSLREAKEFIQIQLSTYKKLQWHIAGWKNTVETVLNISASSDRIYKDQKETIKDLMERLEIKDKIINKLENGEDIVPWYDYVISEDAKKTRTIKELEEQIRKLRETPIVFHYKDFNSN